MVNSTATDGLLAPGLASFFSQGRIDIVHHLPHLSASYPVSPMSTNVHSERNAETWKSFCSPGITPTVWPINRIRQAAPNWLHEVWHDDPTAEPPAADMFEPARRHGKAQCLEECEPKSIPVHSSPGTRKKKKKTPTKTCGV